MANRNNKSDNTFWNKYKKWFIGTIAILIIAYVIIYLMGNTSLFSCDNLEKKDWLAFFGAYLAFSGTIIVSMVATLQSNYNEEKERVRIAKERKSVLQPIFSITIVNIDKQVAGTVETFKISDVSTYPKHKNITISIENVSEYPIRNVIIFDKYMLQLLKPNDEQTFQVAYSDSPDITKYKERLIEIFESEYERTEKGIPKWFNINYEDIDGNEMFQTFELKEFEGTEYYSLEKINTV